MNYKGLRDRHLNVFCGYAKDHHENNITKALINVIDSLSSVDQRRVFEELFDVQIPNGEISATLFLQKPPSEKLITTVPEEKRVLFAFSPTGKTYEVPDGVAENDDIALRNVLRNAVLRELSDDPDPKEVEQEVEKRFADLRARHNHESIPDGWILIYVDGRLEFIVGMEDKLYDLNPFQLCNHLKKGMHCDERHDIVMKTFASIANILDSVDSYMTRQFHEYLMILGYLDVDSIIEVANADPQIRRWLGVTSLSKNMKSLFPERIINKRQWYAVRINDYDWILKEINIQSTDEGVVVPLAFGTTMRTAREIFHRIESPFQKERCPHCNGPWPTFHFQDQWGRNVRKSYICNDGVPYDRYFDFWKKHAEEGRRLKPRNGEPQELLRKMFEGNCLSNHALSEMMTHFSSHSIPVSAVPESMINLFWSWKEIAEMPSSEYFFSQLMSELTTVFDYLGIAKK